MTGYARVLELRCKDIAERSLNALRSLRRRMPSEIGLPAELGPPAFDPASARTVAPVGLTADTVEDFIRWVAAVPVGEVDVVRSALARARGDAAVLEALVVRLFDLPVPDFGRHQLLLSVIGELGDAEALDPLLRFVDLPPDQIFPESTGTDGEGTCTSYLDYFAALQARAIEMVAYLKTAEALQAALAVAARHPSRAVRAAAIDAFLFNQDDSHEAIAAARAAVRPSEAHLVGLPRRERGVDPAEFDRKVLEFYSKNPGEVPPSPRRLGRRRQKHEAPPRPRPRNGEGAAGGPSLRT